MQRLTSVLSAVDRDRWGHMDGWGGGWMWLWGLAIMVLVVVVIVWLIRAGGRNGASSAPRRDHADRAREILAERYARGELTTEEYRERIEVLR